MHRFLIRLYKWETRQIVLLQDKLWSFDSLLGLSSHYLDSKFILYWLLPLVGAYDTRWYAELVLGGFLTIYTNVILKWITADDRPFWWVRETQFYSNLTRPTLRQTDQTCETSPGFPSGHVMFAATILVIFCVRLYEHLVALDKFKQYKILLKTGLSALFVTIITVLALSRMYLGCHFFHQCAVGLILGVLVALVVLRHKVNAKLFTIRNRKSTLYAAIFVFGALSTYWVQKVMNVDPLWSIKMAFKWCEDPFYLKPFTTPVYSLVEAIGLLFSIAFVSPLNQRIKPLNRRKSIPAAVVAMIVRQVLASYTPRFYGVTVYYLYTFALTFSFCYTFLGLLPKYCGLRVRQD